MNKQILVTLTIATIAGILLRWRRHTVTTCCQMIAQLRPLQMHGLDKYVHPTSTALSFDALWTDSQGLRGLWRRWRNSVVFVHLCQVQGEFCPLNDKEMTELLGMASALQWSSLRAAAWGTLRWCSPSRARSAALDTIRQYYAMALETQAFLESGGAHLCAEKFMQVL